MRTQNVVVFLIAAVLCVPVAFYITQANTSILMAVIVALGAGLVAFFKIEYGIYILIFSMLLSPEISVARVPGREVVIRFDDFLVIIIFLAWMARLAINKELGLIKHTPLNRPVLFYIAVTIIFTLKGVILEYVNPVKGFFYALKYIEYYVIFFLVSNVCKTDEAAKKYITAAFITCIIVIIYGYTQIGSGVRVSAPFERTDEPATMGAYLLLAMGVFIAYFLHSTTPKEKFLSGALMVFTFPPFLQTLSRASYMSFGVLAAAALLFARRNKLVLFSIIIGSLLLLPVLLPERVVQRVQVTFSGKGGGMHLDGSSMDRITSWQKIIYEKLPAHFFTGYGVTGVGFIDGQYFLVLGELGIIGFAVFLWVIYSCFNLGFNVNRNSDDILIKSISFGYCIALAALLTHALTANTFIIIRVMEPFWFISGILTVYYKPKAEQQVAQKTIPAA